jgi:plasmid stabilization system protein ParE
LTVPALLTLRARRELAVALERIGEDNPDAAGRLNDAVREAARLIGANPAVGARRPRLANARYRFWSIPRYRCLLAYTDATHPPRILRIVHTSRDLPSVLAELLD